VDLTERGLRRLAWSVSLCTSASTEALGAAILRAVARGAQVGGGRLARFEGTSVRLATNAFPPLESRSRPFLREPRYTQGCGKCLHIDGELFHIQSGLFDFLGAQFDMLWPETLASFDRCLSQPMAAPKNNIKPELCMSELVAIFIVLSRLRCDVPDPLAKFCIAAGNLGERYHDIEFLLKADAPAYRFSDSWVLRAD